MAAPLPAYLRLIFCLSLITYLNIHLPLEAQELKHWETEIASSLALRSGNVDALQVSSDQSVTHRDSLLEMTFATGIDYAEQDDIKLQQHLYARLTADLWYDQTWSPFLLSSIERNFQKRVDQRWQIGAGVKYTFWDDPGNDVSISLAIIRDQTNYDEGAGIEDIEGDARASIRLKGKHRLTATGVTFRHVTFYLPSLDLVKNNESDIRWNTHLRLAVPIVEILALTVAYSYDFENLSGEAEPADSELEVGLKISF